MATSVLVVVPRILAGPWAGPIRAWPPISHRRADAGDCAIDVQHAGGNPEEEQHDDAPWPSAEPAIDCPSQRRRDTDRDHQFDADAQPEPEALLHGRTVTGRNRPADPLRTRPVDPFAKARQRIRRLALAHLTKRPTAPEARPNLLTLPNPVTEAPCLDVVRFAAAADRPQLQLRPAEPRHDVYDRR